MTFANVTNLATSTTFAPTNIGDLMIAIIANNSNNTVTATALTHSSITWTLVGHHAGTDVVCDIALFIGRATSTGSATLTVTWSGTTPSSIGITWQEFSSTTGAWFVDKTAVIESSGSDIWPAPAAASGKELYFGGTGNGAFAVAGNTGGYNYLVDPGNNARASHPSYVGVAPTWTESGSVSGLVALIQEPEIVPPVTQTGRTWKRKFKHRQIPNPPTPVPPITPNGTVPWMHRTGGQVNVPQAPVGVFTPVGNIVTVTGASPAASTLTINPAAVGNVFILMANCWGPGTTTPNPATSVSGGNCNWTLLGNVSNTHVLPVEAAFTYFLGVATATGSSTATVSFTTSIASGQSNLSAQQFSVNGGSAVIDGSVKLLDNSSAGTTAASDTPLQAGDLCVAFGFTTAGNATAGTTQGYVYQIDAGGNGFVYSTVCNSSAQAPSWGSTNIGAGATVLLTLTYPVAVVGGTGISWRHPRQVSRAVVGNQSACAGGQAGQAVPTLNGTVPFFVMSPRRKATRANVGPFGTVYQFIHGIQQPNAPPKELPTFIVLPRRKTARAVVGTTTCASGQSGKTGVYGTLQPKSTHPEARRYPSRAYVRNGAGQIQAPGVQQPVTTRQSRRTTARAVIPFPPHGRIIAPGVQQPVPTRQPRRTISRALVRYSQVYETEAGTTGVYGSLQPKPTHPEARRYPSRVLWHGVSGQIIAPGKQQPWETIPTPRRELRRRVWIGNDPQPWEGFAAPVLQYGRIQPKSTHPEARRYPSRALVHGFAAPVLQYGRIQPRATVPVPRRYPSRQGQWLSGKGPVTASTIGTILGTIQPEATFPQQRRKTYRLVTLHTAGQVFVPLPPGTIQPRTTIPVPRRELRQRYWVGNDPQPWEGFAAKTGVYGSIQPVATRQPRRTTARAYVRNTAAPVLVYGTQQPRQTLPPRRTSARAWVGNTFGPYGGVIGAPQVPAHVQPRMTIPIPRRYPSRAKWLSIAGIPIPPPGTVQPRATVPVPRRTKARAFVRVPFPPAGGIFIPPPPVPAGTVQPRATVPIPRRELRQRYWIANDPQPWDGVAGKTGVYGIRQPWGKVLAPRRYPTRALWNKIKGQIPVYGVQQPVATRQPRRTAYRAVVRNSAGLSFVHGSVQPRATVPVPRRYPSRQGQWASTRGRAIAGFGEIQPRATLPPRRTSARAVVSSHAAPIAVHGSVQPVATFPVSRRKTYRAVTLHTAGAIPVYGKQQPVATRLPRRTSVRAYIRNFAQYIIRIYTIQQPRATMPVPRRVTSRVLWHGNAAPAPVSRIPQPVGTRLPRRTASRAVVRNVSGFPQVPARIQPRATVPVPRRRPSRGTWFIQQGPQPLTAQAGKPLERPKIPQRVKSRVFWQKRHGRFVLTSTTQTIAFNVFNNYSSTVVIAFNIGVASPERHGLATGLPWLSNVDASRRMSDNPQAPYYDGKIRMSENPKGYMQGGDRGP